MKTLEYLDFHVAGEPFRLITRGFPEIIGSTMKETVRQFFHIWFVGTYCNVAFSL